jgi:hypothetical protein
MHFASDSSIYAVINERNVLEDKSENINHLLRCSWQGKILSFQPIDTSGVPRFFHFDEIADEFLLITKGTLYEEVTDSDEQLTVSLFNNKLTPVWRNRSTIKGNLVDLLFTNANFMLVGNSTSYLSHERDEFKFNHGDQSCGFAIYLSREGQIAHVHQYLHPDGLTLSFAEKVSSNHFSFLGNTEPSDKVKEWVYLLVNENGELVFRNDDSLATKKAVRP